MDIKYILAIMTQALPAYLVMFLVALNLMKVIKIRIGFFKSFLAFLLGFLASTALGCILGYSFIVLQWEKYYLFHFLMSVISILVVSFLIRSSSITKKEYRKIIDEKLNNEYSIQTFKNQNFPGIMYYLELIDNAWNDKMTADEGALYIACLYCSGLKENNQLKESWMVRAQIFKNKDFGLSNGTVSEERWEKFSSII